MSITQHEALSARDTVVSGMRPNVQALSVLDTLMSVRSRGARLWVENGQLRYTAPRGVLSSEDIHTLRALRDDLIVLIGQDASDNTVALAPRSAADPVLLTPIQQLAWRSAAETDEPRVRRHALGMHVLGTLRVEMLGRALQSLRSRHEILRSRFLPTAGGGLVQQVDLVGPEWLTIVDISEREHEARARALSDFLKETVRLGEGPLFDARLIRIAHNEYIFAVSLDEMISDCKSNAIVIREIWAEYFRLVRGEEPLTQGDPVQVGDYAVWLRDSHYPWMGAHASYWRERLQDVPAAEGAFGISTGAAVDGDRRSVSITVDTETQGQLASFARERQIFPGLVVLAVCVASIFWCYRRQDMTVVMVDHGRYRPELRNMIGWLVNNLHLRVTMRPEMTFDELLSALSREMEHAHHHRDFNRVPLMLPEVTAHLHFNWRPGLEADVTSQDLAIGDSGVHLRAFSLGSPPARSDFAITFDHGPGITGALEYRLGSRLAGAVDKFVPALNFMLKDFLQHPTRIVGSRQDDTAEVDALLAAPVIHPERRPMPLTFCQTAQWRLHQMKGQPGYRGVACAIRLRGRLNINALIDSVDQLEDRHKVLRTRIVVQEGIPLQEIRDPIGSGLQYRDLTAMPGSERDMEIHRQIDGLILEPVEFATDSLYALRLLKITDVEHVLIVTIEHLISDGFSLDILVTELFWAYERMARNCPVAWPTTSMPFADYAVWHGRSHKSWIQKHGDYWTRLAGCGRVRFPERRQLSLARRSGWGCIPLRFDAELRTQLGAWCRTHCTTVAMSVFTAYVGLVLCWCAVTDAVFRYQINGRVNSRVAATVGFFASRLHLRIELGDSANFVDLMRQIITEYDSALEHADLSYIETLEPLPEFARNTIFNWMSRGNESDARILAGSEDALALEPIPFSNPSFEKLHWDNEPMVMLYDTKHEVTGGIYFPRASFSEDTMEAFAQNFLLFVNYLLTKPEASIQALALLSL